MAASPQKHPEEELAYFKTIVENIADPITISDPAGDVWYRNKAFLELFGNTPPNLYGTLFSDKTEHLNILNANLEGERWRGEVDMLDMQGNPLSIFLKAFPIKDSQDRTIGLARIYRDLSSSKHDRKELQESESKYHSLVENSPDLIYRTDHSGIITFISASVKDLSGYSINEAVGMKMADEVYAIPEEREALLDLLSKTGSVKNFQARLRRKDGSIWWASTNAHFLKDQDGNVTGVEGITRDVTDIKAAEAALKESEERFKMAGKLAYDLIYEWDVKSDTLEWFGDINTILGFDKGVVEPTIKSRLDLIHPEDRKKIASAIEKHRTSREPISMEYRIRNADGGWQTWTDNALPLLEEEGKPVKWIGVCTDITNKKAYETQLEQAQKMESIGTLAGGIAHDFNNLLGGLFGYLNLALKKAEDPKIEKFIKKALQASERAASLTQQLVTFSKGGAPIRRVEPLVSFLRETTRFALSGSNVSCDFVVPDDLWLCNYDKNQIGQAIDNIVINAKDAMPEGGKIKLTAENLTLDNNRIADLEPGRYVRIFISDTGAGIPKEYLPQIFDPFFTTKHSGSGLGLATAYSIIQKHGGAITVDSDPGAGSTFHVFIPAAEDWDSAEKRDANGAYQGNGRVLVMDDDQLMQAMLTDLLEELGYTVVMTSEGGQALEAFKQPHAGDTPFKAVILDLTIRGGMGGKETVSKIRDLDREIPIFVASGYSEDDAIANPESFGFTDSVKKPFGLEQLARVLKKHL